MAETKNRRFKTDRIRKSIFIRYGKEVCNKRTETFSSSLGLEHFKLHIYGKAIDILTDHQALEPFTEPSSKETNQIKPTAQD